MTLSNMFKWLYAPVGQKRENQVYAVCGEKEFLQVLARERARAERSDYRFSLVIFETHGKPGSNTETNLLDELATRLRTADEAGWLQHNRIGAILHNATANNAWSFATNIRLSLLSDGINNLHCKVYSYPPQRMNGAESDGQNPESPERPEAAAHASRQFNRDCFGEELSRHYAKKMTIAKRGLDLLGSLLGLIILAPVFVLVWGLIKSVSPGPAIYRQTRIGLRGRPFTFLKFRTMAIDADTTVHREYLSSLIQGGEDRHGSPAMIKLDDSNRNIIPFGKFIRKTYLDELPQLLNVLRGDMSLIGPRPPIPYEVAEYRLWHSGRFDITPGMTGLWQVSGKNRLTFDQMVRLDIRYIRKQSFWLDVKILLMTPLTIALEVMESVSVKIAWTRIGTEEEPPSHGMAHQK
jgi:lipopolysaccharide/colanic/teichoic acid biosynthesis glycosyltransferase